MRSNMLWISSIRAMLFPRDRLNELSAFDQIRFIALLNINWFSLILILVVTAVNVYTHHYDRALINFSGVFIILVPTLWFTYQYKVNLASWFCILTLYAGILFAITTRLYTGVDSSIDLNFISVCLYALILLEGWTSLLVALLAACSFMASRLLSHYLLHTTQDIGQLLTGFLVFSILIYFGMVVKTIIVNARQAIIDQTNQLEKQNEKLAELNELKNKLFSIIGHDLRSPIASLKTQLMSLQEGYISPVTFEERTGQLTQMVDNVYLAMDNLLHWSMLQREGLLPQTSQLDLAELTESVLRLYHTEMQQKHLRLHTQLGPTPVQADELQLQIVVRNLLHNAIKFTPPGGSLTLSSGEQSGQGWLRIADTGVGMVLTPAGGKSAQVVPGRGTAGEKGTGLGLALCREFVRLNGGALTIDSTPGQGTTVSIRFPICPSNDLSAHNYASYSYS